MADDMTPEELRQEAIKRLREIEENRPRWEGYVDTLRELRKTNNFGPNIARALGLR